MYRLWRCASSGWRAHLPSDAGAELSKDKKAYLDAIWPVIAAANATVPSHSQLLPEMVDILPYGTEIPVATKISILRPACYKKFASVIDAIYERFEQANDSLKKDITSQSDMEVYLTDIILNALGDKATAPLTPSSDLFVYGVDSLHATRVRNVIIKTLELGGAKPSQNVVYEYPTISILATHLLALRSGQASDNSTEATHTLMLGMVDQFASQLVKPASSDSHATNPQGQVIILTGATGSLGAHILDQLTRRPEVSKVICLSRAKSHDDSLSRVQASLASRLRTLSPEATSKIVSLAADVNAPRLGLTESEYELLHTQATAIIHNARPVNLNLSPESFEEHIQGVVNLLNLSLLSLHHAGIFFSSSVSTCQGRPDPLVKEVCPDGPATAAGMGYGRSKWVVEKTYERAG